MELKLIKQQVCECGAPTVEESCRSVHTNGQGFERRQFACGHVISWSPNFGCLEENQPCPNSAEQKKFAQEQQDVEALLFDTLRKTIKTKLASPRAAQYWLNRINWNERHFRQHNFLSPTNE